MNVERVGGDEKETNNVHTPEDGEKIAEEIGREVSLSRKSKTEEGVKMKRVRNVTRLSHR